MAHTNRRDFLKNLTAISTAALSAASALKAATPNWKQQIGLEMYTVRDLTPKDYEGTLAKIAAIGYKEIEPASADYGGMQPKQFRAMLDRYGVTMPSTHIGATAGPGLEKELEGFQLMGLKYTEVKGGGNGPAPKDPQEATKRTAQLLNEHGKIAKKFGMKMLYHNHAPEFQPFEGSALRPYDILLSETDPSLVAMQLDIGWATVAGQDVLEMFKKNPGRFELWHVKDAKGIKTLDPKFNQRQRMQNIMLVPIGQGEVNYKPIFAQAEQAGMKHFCIEQDNAAAWGDSVAAAKVSYDALAKVLS